MCWSWTELRQIFTPALPLDRHGTESQRRGVAWRVGRGHWNSLGRALGRLSLTVGPRPTRGDDWARGLLTISRGGAPCQARGRRVLPIEIAELTTMKTDGGAKRLEPS